MFQVQEEMNRAERIAGAAAAAAAASAAAAAATSAKAGASPSASPAVSPSASPQPITAGARRSPEQQRVDRFNEKRLRCSPKGSPSPSISDTPHRAAVAAAVSPGFKATPRSSAGDAAAVSAPKPPQVARRKQQQESTQGRHGPLSPCPAAPATEAATAAAVGEVGAQDREELRRRQGVAVSSGGSSPVSSPLRQGLQYREYAAGVSAASYPAKKTTRPSKDGRGSPGSGEPTSSQRGEIKHGTKAASAGAVSAAAGAEAGSAAGSRSGAKPNVALSAARCPLVAPPCASVPPPPSSTGTQVEEGSLRSGPGAKPAWASPKCVANQNGDAAPESTPSRLVSLEAA